jgi:hypothetical protein
MSASVFDQVKRLAETLTNEERRNLVRSLSEGLEYSGHAATNVRPRSLRGTWRCKFPEAVEIDDLLNSIRSEWQGEFKDL